MDTETVTCSRCRSRVPVQAGYLSEDQKRTYVCEVCNTHPTVEDRTEHEAMHEGGRRVLTEDLPQFE